MKKMEKDSERNRYARLTAIEEIGEGGMQKLQNASVMVVGCGALGSLCAMYLAGSGVKRIGIADFDTIDLSNLQRQLFFEESQAGEPKIDVLEKRMRALNSSTEITSYKFLITEKLASSIFPIYDFIIDATDNPASKMMVDKVCREIGKPYCIGGVRGFEGQVMSWQPGTTPYNEIFAEVSCQSGYMPCSIGGVLGPAAGVVASIEASEAIKHLAGTGGMLYNKIFTINLLTMQSNLIMLD